MKRKREKSKTYAYRIVGIQFNRIKYVTEKSEIYIEITTEEDRQFLLSFFLLCETTTVKRGEAHDFAQSETKTIPLKTDKESFRIE